MCVKGHIALCDAWEMKSGFHNVGFFHISVSSISSAPFSDGSHFYTCRNESVMRLGGKEDRELPRMDYTRALTSLIEYSSLSRSIFQRGEIEVNFERIMTSIFPQSMKPGGTAVAQWLIGRSLVRSQPVPLELFIDINSFRSHYGPGVDSASNRNEYQYYFLWVKAAGA